MSTRIAVIGCGHAGRRHIEVLSAGTPFELAAVCDIDEAARAAVKLPVPAFKSIGGLLSSGIEFDAASIATPNGLHETHAIALLQAGKHVIIEKPMGLSATSCQRIINEAEKNNKQAFCILQIKFSPVARWLKQLVEKGIPGRIFMVQVNCFWNRNERYYKPGGWHGTLQMDGGTLYTQFSHYIDLLYWLFGDVKNVSGKISTFRNGNITEIEDTGTVSWEFVNGGLASFNFSTAVKDSNLESNLTIIAENGTVKIGGQYMNQVQYCNFPLSNLEAPPVADNTNYHHAFFADAANAMQQGLNSGSNAKEAMKVVGIIENIYSSCRQ